MTLEQIQAAVEKATRCHGFALSDQQKGDGVVKLSPGTVMRLCEAVLEMAAEIERLKKIETAATAEADLEARLRTINGIAKRRAEAGLAVDLRIEAESRLEDR